MTRDGSVWGVEVTWFWIVKPSFGLVGCFGIGVDVRRPGVVFPPLDLEDTKPE